jgi:DNA polymerase-3 subunit epsilon
LERTSPPPPESFVAIDFETADRSSDSACAVALVRVEDLRVVERRSCLLRPPRSRFVFTYVHGITWAHVAGAAPFEEAWPELARLLEGAEFLAAHNAGFDHGVLNACCGAAGLPPPELPFLCTMRLARRVWNIRPTRLPDVCARLGLPLRHHDVTSDAEACAGIVLAAARLYRASLTNK